MSYSILLVVPPSPQSETSNNNNYLSTRKRDKMRWKSAENKFATLFSHTTKMKTFSMITAIPIWVTLLALFLAQFNPTQSASVDFNKDVCEKEEFYQPYAKVFKKRKGPVVAAVYQSGFIDLKLHSGLLCINGPYEKIKLSHFANEIRIIFTKHLQQSLRVHGGAAEPFRAARCAGVQPRLFRVQPS
jgi:hypothetical protein